MRRPAVDDPLWLGQYRVLAELARDEATRVLLGSGPDDRLVSLTLPRTAESRAETAALSAVLEADPDASTPWHASEFHPGPSLQEVPDPLPEPAVVRLAAGIAADLTQLHSAGLAHGSLDPSHVRLTANGARLIPRAAGKDPADDLLALGSLLAAQPAIPEALRRCLAENTTAAELLEAIGPATAPWPPEVGKLIAERTAELAQFLDAQPVPHLETDSVIYQVTDPPETPRRPRSRRRILIGALTVVIAGLAAWIAWPSPPALPPAPQPPLVESGFLVARAHPQFLQFSHDGRLLATANADFTMDVLDVGTRKPAGPRVGPFPETGLTGLAFGPDGRTLVTSRVKDAQLTTQAWDPRTGREIGPPLVIDGIDRDSGSSALSSDARLLAVPMVSPRRLDLWRIADHTRIGSIDTPTTFRYSEFNPDGRTLVVYEWDGHSAHSSQLRLWDTASLTPAGDPIAVAENDHICCLAFRPDGRTLITTSGEARTAAKVHQWDTATHQELRPGFTLAPAQIDQQSGTVLFTMALAGLDDQHLLALSAGTLVVLGLDGKQEGAGVPGIASLGVSPDLQTVATTSGSTADKTVHLWRKP
ncbi:protein kinase family protein [Amycolatopsis sp. VC5-11]|uniref:protein kinase family protein n=1 Tax=Amycolatopsis sp. VC5-11 TaxID=3120156 RepID=UPI00300987F0